jgi:hypothetical protein
MHLGPFHLFIILLLILMVASFARNWGLTEGFVTFNQSLSAFTKVKVPAYDKTNTITKLYDDIYYDQRNGNAVILTGTASTPALITEPEGTTVTAIDIYQRKGGSSTRYNTPATVNNGSTTAFQQTTDESKISSIPSMVKEWSIISAVKNQLNYLSWGTNTFLSVFNLTNTGRVARDAVGIQGAAGYSAAVVPTYQICATTNYSGNVANIQNTHTVNIPITASYTYADDATADKDYVEAIYDSSKNLYKFLNNVYYDVANGNLLMNTSTSSTAKSINVYYRTQATGLVSNSSITALSGTTQSAAAVEATKRDFTTAQNNPWFVTDAVNNNTIMYWPSGSSTILMAFANKFVSGVGIPILKVRRFTNNGIYSDNNLSSGASSSGASSSGASSSGASSSGSSGNDIDESLLDAFSRWYIYFNTSAVGSGNSSDYLLKTQIVPPVCPACPACPNGGGSCGNCGGQGGSGTLYGGGSLADVKGPSSGLASIGQSAGSAISGTANALGATALGTGMVAGNIVNNTVNTAGNLVGKTLDTAGNIVGGTVGTAGNIIGGTVGAASNLLQSAGSGVTNLLGANNPNRFGYDQSYRGPNQNNVGSYGYVPQQNYMASSGTYNQGSAPGSNVDIYSQYGALPSKGSSNYRPITTDFSSFRK